MSVLLAGAGIVVALYVVSVFLWPRTRCRRCQAFSGRDHSILPFQGRAYRKCRRCGGKGWHVRPLRRWLGGRNKFDGSGVWQGP